MIQPFEIKHQRVLVTALNWGMGHLARCIPLIRVLQEQGNLIYFAGNEEQRGIIHGYFPDINLIPLADYPFRFTLRYSFKVSLLRSLLSLVRHLRYEHQAISSIVQEHVIEVIISDQRYGCHFKGIPSIFITHQINFPLNGIWRMGNYFHQRLMMRFDAIWIPDFSDSRLSGKLSSRTKVSLPISFIGVLSRFSLNSSRLKSNNIVVILSGPDDYAVAFAQQYITPELMNKPVIIIGREEVINQLDGLFPVKFQCSSDWLVCDEIIQSASVILAACGYSTIMDIQFLNCTAVLYPTPGQLEQEYLAQLHGTKWKKELVEVVKI